MATSFYKCPPQYKQKFCVFENLSSCSDHEGEFFCNKHLQMIFKLTIKPADYTTVSNNHANRLETYICSNTKLKINLFVDFRNNNILLPDVVQYARYIAENNKNQGIIESKLADNIGYYLGMNAYSRVTDYTTCRSWVNEPGVYIAQLEGKVLTYVPGKTLPNLHKMLLSGMRPSFYFNQATQIKRVFLENFIMELDESINKYVFTTINDHLTLKYTNNKNCVATPITVMAIHIDYQEKSAVSFKTTDDTMGCI